MQNVRTHVFVEGEIILFAHFRLMSIITIL